MPQTIVVLGARNLGGAIVDHFLELGWSAARGRPQSGHARPGQRARRAGAATPTRPIRCRCPGALATAREELGVARRDRQRGQRRAPAQRARRRSGAASSPPPISRTSAAGRSRSPSRRSRSCRPAPPRCKQAGGGALVQITGGSSRRAISGPRAVGGRRVRDPCARPGRRAGAARRGHPRRAAGRRRDDRVAQDGRYTQRPAARGARRHGSSSPRRWRSWCSSARAPTRTS